MKFSNGSSSSSLASDSLSRKSTLCIYTDADFLNGPKEMDAGSSNGQSGAGEVAELKRELANVHRALMLQSDALARQQQRAGDLELRLANRNAASDRRLQARDQQLATLVHALLILEAKLKRDQKMISLQFQTKNAQILQQREQIKKLKHEAARDGSAYCKNCQHLIGSTSEQTNIETDPEFHSLESVETHNSGKFERSLSYQEKLKSARSSKAFQLPKSNEPNQQGNTSSSEEVFENGEAFSQCKGTYVKNKQAFVRKDVTRRSRKYSGRRQSSAYLDSVQKKDRSQASSSSAEDGAQSERDSKVSNKYDIGEEITKDIEKTSNRIDELLNASQSNENCLFNDSVQLRLQKTNNRSMSLSNKIDSLHGIRKPASERLSLQSESFLDRESMESDKPWYNNISDPEPEIECHYSIKREKQKRYRYKSADDILTATFNDTDANTDVNSNNIPLEYLPTLKATNENDNEAHKNNDSNSACGNNEPEYCSVSNSIRDSAIYDEAGSNKFDNEPSENWYASASDQDEDQSCGIYKNNPVLECVNQILLQNNLDENSNDQKNHETSPKASTKRVQFSTLNSISFEEHVKRTEGTNKDPKIRGNNKIVKFSLETASEHSYEVPNTSEGFNYEIQSIYSNDYEPILTKPSNIPVQKSKLKPVPLPRMLNDTKKPSLVKNMAMNLEHKMNGNHYVDMDKFGGTGTATNKKKTPRVPPALPPKPKNLVSKFKINNGSALPVVNATLNSDTVDPNQRIADVPDAKVKQDSSEASVKSSNGAEPDYCSISEINVPVDSNKNEVVLSQTTVEIHAEQFSPNIAERRPQISKVATISKIPPNKICDKDIPKLPQVTEIIIPDDEEDSDAQTKTLRDSFVKKPPNPKIDNRNSIQMGHSVSSILTDIKNRSVGIEDVNKCILTSDNRQQQYPNVIYQKANVLNGNSKSPDKPRLDSSRYENDAEKFDLSQNFEEFKIDDCEFTNIALAEEYKISSSESTDSNNDDSNPIPKENFRKLSQTTPSESLYKIELIPDDETDMKIPLGSESLHSTIKTALKNYSKMSNKPDLLSNIDNLEADSVRYSDIESSNSSGSNCGSYNTVKREPSIDKSPTDSIISRKNISIPFEYFLETSGLSSKSILTPSRPPNSNHKNVLKPKDIKMRSKNATTLGRATPLYEKCSNTAIKYFEPYL